MSDRSLQELVESTDPARFLRENSGAYPFPFPDEYTHWIEEQRAWRETCALADQSYHMTGLHVEGPDALGLYADLGVNSFADFPVGRAKQLVTCNPDGYLIGDGILYHLAADTFFSIGVPTVANWLTFNAETGDYDVETERSGSAFEVDGDPEYFRFQLQGPNAMALIEDVADGPVPDVPFFGFDDLDVCGHTVQGLRHGMAGEAGLELWGPFEWGAEIKETLLDVGADYGLRQLGSKSYESTAVESGWIALPVPAIYEHEDLREYREWLDADAFEGILSIGGSYAPEAVTDYYMTPYDLGYGHHVAFDHDFLGREALESMAAAPERTKVTLVWDATDVVDVFASLFRDGETYKFMDLVAPRWSAAHYDRVLDGERTVGVSKYLGYTYNERKFLSLASVETDLAEPGTDVTVVWGEADSPKPNVERHVEREIRATVAPVPYKPDRRKDPTA